MRRWLAKPGIALALTCLLGAGLPAAAAVSPLAGQQPPAGCHDRLNSHDGLNTITVPPPKVVNITDDHVNVILPQGYCDSSRGSARYAVLYLLHGAGDTYGAWAAKTDVVSFSKAYRLIIVMADGGANRTAGWYSNWLDGEYQWETYGIFQMNLSMVRALDLAGVAHTDDFYPGGYHGWPYWQADLHWALPRIASILEADAAHH